MSERVKFNRLVTRDKDSLDNFNGRSISIRQTIRYEDSNRTVPNYEHHNCITYSNGESVNGFNIEFFDSKKMERLFYLNPLDSGSSSFIDNIKNILPYRDVADMDDLLVDVSRSSYINVFTIENPHNSKYDDIYTGYMYFDANKNNDSFEIIVRCFKIAVIDIDTRGYILNSDYSNRESFNIIITIPHFSLSTLTVDSDVKLLKTISRFEDDPDVTITSFDLTCDNENMSKRLHIDDINCIIFSTRMFNRNLPR